LPPPFQPPAQNRRCNIGRFPCFYWVFNRMASGQHHCEKISDKSNILFKPEKILPIYLIVTVRVINNKLNKITLCQQTQHQT
jgi:hypothetical protein